MTTPIDYVVRIAGTSLIGGGFLLDDVQSVSWNRGREWATDPYAPASCVIRSRNISAWTSTPAIGDLVGVYAAGTTFFGGWIKDVQIQYGIVPNLDVAVITCEGPLSRWGRRQFNNRSIAQAKTLTQLSTLATATGLNASTSTNGTGLSTASAQTYSGNGLDLLNEVMMTEVGHVSEMSLVSGTYMPYTVLYPRNYDTVADYTFADTGATNTIKYKEIEFTSAAENYYTEVTINPQGLAAQQAGSGNYGLTQNSVDYTTGQALSHAQYLVGQYNSTTSTPHAITFDYESQAASSLNLCRALIGDLVSFSGSLFTLVFRGNTYKVVCEGLQVDATTSSTTARMTFSAFDNNNYLILDNAVFGTLGTSGTYPGNKLGF
jgi:hypothetical protein